MRSPSVHTSSGILLKLLLENILNICQSERWEMNRGVWAGLRIELRAIEISLCFQGGVFRKDRLPCLLKKNINMNTVCDKLILML